MEDYRLQFYSYGNNTFLQVVKENKRLIDFYLNEWTSTKPKTKSSGYKKATKALEELKRYAP